MVQARHSVSLIMDGWQWSDFGNRFSLTPSVPRFNPRFVISETGGGYRLYSFPNHPKWVEVLLLSILGRYSCDFLNGIDLEFPALLSLYSKRWDIYTVKGLDWLKV
ncbi:hypothetical protein [Limnospira fusiformis]|uniref:hypothetical protein n=1 Tax=Limnospira fusiformis TaxID=54297 RepID=UPI00054E2520|nr:hypothetical protein HFV01_10660 [Limnospira fusiformis SAG 85.79]UWU48215.1 hypothetical protein APLC1_3005 [Arthrospira platensis C1]